MKQITARRARRLGVAEAKARLPEVLRDAATGPTIIHNRGRDLAVVLDADEYERLAAGHDPRPGAGATFLDRVEALKARHGGGVDAFTPPRLRLRAVHPSARGSRHRT